MSSNTNQELMFDAMLNQGTSQTCLSTSVTFVERLLRLDKLFRDINPPTTRVLAKGIIILVEP